MTAPFHAPFRSLKERALIILLFVSIVPLSNKVIAQSKRTNEWDRQIIRLGALDVHGDAQIDILLATVLIGYDRLSLSLHHSLEKDSAGDFRSCWTILPLKSCIVLAGEGFTVWKSMGGDSRAFKTSELRRFQRFSPPSVAILDGDHKEALSKNGYVYHYSHGLLEWFEDPKGNRYAVTAETSLIHKIVNLKTKETVVDVDYNLLGNPTLIRIEKGPIFNLDYSKGGPPQLLRIYGSQEFLFTYSNGLVESISSASEKRTFEWGRPAKGFKPIPQIADGWKYTFALTRTGTSVERSSSGNRKERLIFDRSKHIADRFLNGSWIEAESLLDN